MDVHARSEQRVHTILAQLISGHLIKLLCQFQIKGASDQCTVWKRERLGSAVHTKSGRSVCRAGCWDAERTQFLGKATECTRCTCGYLRAAHSLCMKKHDQLLVRQLCNKFIHRDLLVIYICKFIALVTGVSNLFRFLNAVVWTKFTRRNLLVHKRSVCVSCHSLKLFRRRTGFFQLFNHL